MLHYKSTKIISELKNYFSSNEKIFQTLFRELGSLKISDKHFLSVDKKNTQYSGYQIFTLLMLFPLFGFKDISHYKESPLYQVVKCGKDVFYRFINNCNFSWRKLSYQVNLRLLKRIEKSSYNNDNQPIRCLIADDTDLPKRGRHFELLSRIYSHVSNSFNYGFKGLFLGYHDGTSFFGLDFSLHGEKGDEKKPNFKPYGLTKKQQKARYSKNRNAKSASKQRENEYFKSKSEMLIEMIKTAIFKGIRFDYLLTDSWFTCFELVKFISTRRIGCHFLGMLKRGTTKYIFKDKELNFNQILTILKRQKMQRNRKLNCHFYEIIVNFKGISVKIFFCKMGKNGVWHGLLTTNTKLSFEKAFEIYSTRWTIEVFFKECKQYLRLGKCESVDFDAQIASTTLCMLQYNLFSAVRRFESYESFGALFRAAKAETIEMNVKERIWLIITEILTKLAVFFELDIEILTQQIITDNQQITNIINLDAIKSKE
jgi:hypothetical protein